MKRNQALLKNLIVAITLFMTATVMAVTVEDLRNDPKLTPARFASYFSNFKFEFRAEVQSPETFLSTQSGDCDDYATLADAILREKGYTTHLIAVRMTDVVHVVCYVEETKSFLDYNDRNCFIRTTQAAPNLQAIAGKVAKSFDAKWASASEFTYEGGLKRLVQTVVEKNKQYASLIRSSTVIAAAGTPSPF